MIRKSFTALFISTICCLSAALTSFGAVPDDSAPVLSGPGVTALADTEESSSDEKGESLGMFTTTGYCNCEKCNSGGHALTYSGTVPQAAHTISADLTLYPIGTRLMIGDIIYTVEDKGTHVEGNWIDVYYDNHEDAWNHGLKTEEVFAIIESDPVQN